MNASVIVSFPPPQERVWKPALSPLSVWPCVCVYTSDEGSKSLTHTHTPHKSSMTVARGAHNVAIYNMQRSKRKAKKNKTNMVINIFSPFRVLPSLSHSLISLSPSSLTLYSTLFSILNVGVLLASNPPLSVKSCILTAVCVLGNTK